MQNSQYSINVVYKNLMGTINKVYWAIAMWNRAVIPRSRFVVWLAYHERLKTKQCLKRMGVVDDDLCPICGTQPETTEHLFFKYNFSAQCTKACKLDGRKLEHWEYERHASKTSSTQGKITTHNRDLLQPCLCYLEGSKRCSMVEKVMTVGRVIDTIKVDSKHRFASLSPIGGIALWLRHL